MDYLNCKDLPVWAQILVGIRPVEEDGEQDEGEMQEEVPSKRAAAA
jgi:hypothetical protein